jgi:hypothetical protein
VGRQVAANGLGGRFSIAIDSLAKPGGATL